MLDHRLRSVAVPAEWADRVDDALSAAGYVVEDVLTFTPIKRAGAA